MRQLFFVLSTIGTIYVVASTLEQMKDAAAQKAREDEMLALLRSINAKLQARAT